MKLTVIPNNINNIKEYIKIGANAFIFALKDYSCGYEKYYSLDEIKSVIKDNDIEVFISLNKNFFNEELDDLEKVLIEISNMNVKGVLFYDLAVLSLRDKNKLNLDLVWNQTHMVTNYNTCNYYYDKNVKYGVVSKEITVEEINEMNKNTNMSLMSYIFCYPLMSYTRRSLLTNYFKSHNYNKKNNKYIVVNNDEEYIVNEEESGTAFYINKLLNGSDVINSITTDYLIFDESFIDHELFIKVFELFKKYYESKDESIKKEIDDLVGDYSGFFHIKTIYKVKKND